jgi:NTP pyrophosphatase (non-canonical NTP hydrolase)
VIGSGDRIQNLKDALFAGDMLDNAGLIPFVPHMYLTWEIYTNLTIESWEQHVRAMNMAWLESCDVLVRLPGESPGSDREVARMRELHRPVYEWEDHGAASGDKFTPVRHCINEFQAGKLEEILKRKRPQRQQQRPLLDLRAFQEALKSWIERQPFGKDQDPVEPLLGIGEELGELMHAHLKERQKIRGTSEEMRAQAKDAIGDMLIYMTGYCTARGWSMHECLELAWDTVRKRDWYSNPDNGEAVHPGAKAYLEKIESPYPRPTEEPD